MDDETAAAARRTLLAEMVAEGQLRRDGELVLLDFAGRAYMVEMRLHDVTDV